MSVLLPGVGEQNAQIAAAGTDGSDWAFTRLPTENTRAQAARALNGKPPTPDNMATVSLSLTLFLLFPLPAAF